MRQVNLLALRDELKRRGITSESFRASFREITRQVRRTRYQPLRQAIDQGQEVRCVTLKGFRGLLRWQTQTQTLFAREISDRVRVIACLTLLPNIIHSDTLSETLSSSEWSAIQKAVSAESDDTLVLIWGSPRDVETGAQEVIIRAREATLGVPSETRQALADGTTGFERILPGPDRMYPDTDLPPLRIAPDRVERIRRTLPEPIWEREARYRTLGIPADTIEPLAVSQWADLFHQAVEEWHLPPTLVAVALIQYPKRLRKKKLPVQALDEALLRRLFCALRDGQLIADGLLEAMEILLRNKFWQFPPPLPQDEIDEAIETALQETRDMSDPQKRLQRCMGRVMRPVRGRIEGAKAAQLVQTRLNPADKTSRTVKRG